MNNKITFINPKDTPYHKERQQYAAQIYDTPNMLPYRYVLVLTNHCNLHCSFCYQKKNYIEGSMTTDDWLKFIDQLPQYAWVTMTGGEPFIFNGFNKVFRKIASRFKCNIISNGLMLTDELIELLLEYPNFKILSISIDDIGNKVRNVNPKKWEKVEEMMQRFVKRKNELKSETLLDSKTVVLDQNADALLDIHRYCMETLQCDTHSFQLLKGSPMQHADHMFQIDDMLKKSEVAFYEKWPEICRQFEMVRQYNLANRKTCYLHPKIADLNSNKQIDKNALDYITLKEFVRENYHKCKVPWESVHINVDGNLFPCMAIKMGNVKEQPLAEIINGKIFSTFKRYIRDQGLVEGCHRCGYLLPKKNISEIYNTKTPQFSTAL